MKREEISLEHITKIEGHARLDLRIRGGKVEAANIEVFESARFFEALLRGRRFADAPVLTSRICGICSPAHLICSLKAVEAAYGIQPLPLTEDLRRLMLAGSIIQNHASHLFLFALPDYLGFRDAFSMAAKKPGLIEKALKLREAGNLLVNATGKQMVHPFTARINAFSRVPTRSELNAIERELKNARRLAFDAIELFEKNVDTCFKRQTQYLALSSKKEYGFYEGGLCFSGLNVCAPDYSKHVDEVIRPYSTAKFAFFRGKPFACGARARFALNKKFLSDDAKAFAKRLDLRSPHSNNIAQAIEILEFIDYCLELIPELSLEEATVVQSPPPIEEIKPTRGVAAIEAPRGTLLHDYHIDEKGVVRTANIITPTAQNLGNLEEDVRALVALLLKQRKPREKIVFELEKLVRAYDPCISCSTHFLQVNFK